MIPTAVAAQSSQTVPPDDPIYLFVDKLVGARLVDTILTGQRTMSRREIGRIIAEARGRLSADTGWIGSKLGEYSTQYPAVLARAPLVAAYGIDAIVSESPSRGIEPDANGAISVVVNPLLSNQLGRPLASGVTTSGVAEVGVGAAPWLAVHARARVSRLDERQGNTETTTVLEQGYARGLWKNAALLVGRDYLFLGQGNTAGLTASLSPRGVTQVRLSSDRPFVLPSLLRHVGPIQAIIALGDLGPGQFFPHSRL
ncbi:MAG: capsule assembly Wzi family protein, partial [Gemmatimonadaceae bacterium]